MDLPHTSRLRFLSSDGKEIDGPGEWSPALVELVVEPEEWDQARVWLQGEALDVYLKVLGGRKKVLADWARADTGYYRLRLEAPGWIEERTVEVWPQKIGRETYARLLEDLETRLPVQVAVALQRAGGLAGVQLPEGVETTLGQELVRLRRAVRGTATRPGLDRVLPEIAKGPHQILVSDEMWVQREKARRPHPARLVQAYASGHNLDAGGLALRVVDMRVEHTADVYENRMVKLFVEQVDRRLRRLGSVAVAQKYESIRGEVDRLGRELGVARRQARFLDGVNKLAHMPDRVTMVLAKRAPYRAALEGFLDLHKAVSVSLDEPAFDAPLANLPYLYQVWGTLQVIVALQEAAVEYGYRVREERLIRREGGEVFVKVLSDGKPAVELTRDEDGTVVRLIPERTFGGSGNLRSITYIQRPDVVVEVERPGKRRELYLFDPKYKLWSEKEVELGERGSDREEEERAVEEGYEGAGKGRPTKVDIDKMHAYRDAIRDENGERVVEYAAILYPGKRVTWGHGIEALQALPALDGGLRERVRDVLLAALGAR